MDFAQAVKREVARKVVQDAILELQWINVQDVRK
jgi:hypothetical protein